MKYIFNDEYAKDVYVRNNTENQNCREIITHLWTFLEDEAENNMTVELLSQFNTLMPKMFSDVITQALSDQKHQDHHINKFNKFWKLTADKNVQFADPICIFNMIRFLDSQTPAVRLASKSWLAGTTGYLRWVLDPILNVLLEETTIAEKGVNNELYFQTEYESRLVIHAF